MPYIGPAPQSARFAIVDQISGGFNGVNTEFRIRVGGLNTEPGTAANMLVVLNGSGQTPSGNATYGSNFDYSVSGSVLTFETPPPAGTTFYGEIFGPTLGIGQPSDNTVLPASITTNSAADFIFPADVTATGSINGASGIFTVVSGSTRVFGQFVRGTSGQFDTLDVINTFTAQDFVVENDIVVSGDLSVSGNISTTTGNITATSGIVSGQTVQAATGTFTNQLSGVTITGQNLGILEGITAASVTAANITGTTNVSGAFVFGPTLSGQNLVTAPTGIFTNISGDELHVNDLTVTGSITLTGLAPGIFSSGNIHCSGIFAQSGEISGTLSGQTVTGEQASFTSGAFGTLTATTFNPTTVTAETGLFSRLVSGVSGVFDNLNFNGTIESETGVFTTIVSGATVTGDTGNFTTINVTSLTGEVITATRMFSGNANNVTVTGRTGVEVTTSGVILFGPVTILP